jgi:O-acetyl-ADP-ribose deacetylase (regulator of RNase III)
MIRYATGNLLTAQAEALVNTVNEKGVMGKGIALMFKEAFPGSSREYEEASRKGEVRVGHVLVTRSGRAGLPRWIIHFPTKRHWRHPSKLEWIQTGLRDLVHVVLELGIKSIALPPLGSGNGRLDWNLVKAEIEASMSDLADVDVIVYEPTAAYMNVPKTSGVVQLTPARALVAELVRRYSILGLDCTNLEAQKLAWFLERSILAMGLKDPLRLSFKADRYGPYADKLRHLLNSLDGAYLHAQRRLADSGPYECIWFEPSRREQLTAYLHSAEACEYLPALEQASAVIEGFESPLGMELLATVDWVIFERKTEPSVTAIKRELARWPGAAESGARKLRLFSDRLLQLALRRLVDDRPISHPQIA